MDHGCLLPVALAEACASAELDLFIFKSLGVVRMGLLCFTFSWEVGRAGVVLVGQRL